MTLRQIVYMALAASLTQASAAQAGDREMTLTRRLGMGARSMGMGGASVALVDDGSALFLNPAGLARVRRIELAGGIKHQSYGLDTRYFGDASEGSSVATRLGSVSGVYPFPTYRGSLVLAGGVERVFSSDIEMLYQGEEIFDSVPFSESESYSVTGGVSGWAVGGAMDVSPNVSLGATVILWDGHDDVTNSYECLSCVDDVDFYRTISTDYSGFSAIVGLQARLGPHLSVGGSVESPIAFTLEGTEARYGDDGITQWYRDEVRLPFSFIGGAALRLGSLTMAGDIRYTDWRQIEYEGILKDAGTFDYRSTTELHLGAEYLFPFYPLRARAGYYREPLAYNDSEIDEDRSFYTVGGGLLVDDVIAIDAAVVIGDLRWTQDFLGRSIYREESFTRLFVTTAYRF